MRINEGLKHYTIYEIAEGVFAAIHKYGGHAYSNSGIINLGDETIIIDAGNSDVSGTELRQLTKLLTGRDASRIILTHVHTDHWNGAQAFPEETRILTTEKLERLMPLRARRYLTLKNDQTELHQHLDDLEKELEKQSEPIWIEQVLTSITRTKQMIEFVKNYDPRYSNETFSGRKEIRGTERRISILELGAVHSSNDLIVELKKDNIQFIGDVGFFNLQPFMAMGRYNNWTTEINRLIGSDMELMVPGHGEVGGKKELEMQLKYFTEIETKVSEVVYNEGSLDDSLQIKMDSIFEPWLRNGLYRYDMNIKFMFNRISHKKKAEEEKAKQR